MIEEMLAYNREFVRSKGYEKFQTSKYPDKKIAILTCMDTRLVELLPAALGIRNGDVKLIKNAGGMITGPFDSAERSLLVGIIELGVEEVMVIGHTDCGVYRKTTITTTAGERVTMNFASEGSYKDTVETIKVEMIAKEKSPFWVTLDGRKIEHFLNRRKFDAAAEGWYYSQSKKAVEVKYANPAKDHELTVSFEQFDLIGM